MPPTDTPTLPDFRLDTLDDRAVALIGYQRSKHVSRAARAAWQSGDPAPLLAEARAGRDLVLGAVLAEIAAEYRSLKSFLDARRVSPRHVIDIGCGQALNDLFLARDFAPAFTLVDIEETPEQYHGWATSGSGYASLSAAKAFLAGNGTDAARIVTLNPTTEPESAAELSGDLVTSLYSCGFHYPVDAYADVFCRTVEGGGTVVLDLRRRYLTSGSPGLDRLRQAARAHVLIDDRKSQRIAFRNE